MRFALSGRALPPRAEALRLTDRFRAAVLARADRLEADSIARLRGRDPRTGEILTGNRHAHYLATDEDGDGRIDHLTVYCADRLSVEELDALAVPYLRSWAFDHPIGCLLLDVSPPAPLPGPGPLGAAREWRSHTPFLPPRHPKRRGGRIVGGPVEQVALELRRRGLPGPLAISPVPPERIPWGAYRRSRTGTGWHGTSAHGFHITFAEPVQGPIALGLSSHFGMGLFLPV